MTWQPIDTAPKLKRLLVAGWQPELRKCAGYWWYYEDMTDENGVPMNHPTALQWMPWPAPPALP